MDNLALCSCSYLFRRFLVASLISCSVLPILISRDQGIKDMELMRRMREVSWIMSFVSLVCCGCYLHLALDNSQHLLVSQSNWLTGAEELRLMGRYMLWALLAPLQWVSFARLYTTASSKEIASLALTTALVMLLGLLSAHSRSCIGSKVIWEYQGRCYFAAAFVCFLVMFWQVHSLPLDPGSMPLAKKHLRFAFLLWAAYPAVHTSRSLGLITLWQEQIFAYTFLDVVAKGVSLSICFCGPAFRMFLSSLGNHQIQSAMVDWKITVSDPGWEIKKPSADALAAMQVHWFGGDAVGKNFFDWILHDNESREAVRSTARLIDADSRFITRKVPVLLRLNDERVQALLFVSRAVWGSRQIACALLEGVESMPQPSNQVSDEAQPSSQLPGPQIAKAVEKACEEESDRGTVITAKTGVSSIGGAIPLFRVDGRNNP